MAAYENAGLTAEAEAAFDRVRLAAERTRAGLVGGLFAALTAALVVRIAVAFTGPQPADGRTAVTILTFLASMIALETWLWRDAQRRLRDGQPPSSVVAYAATVAEVGAFALGTGLGAGPGPGTLVLLVALVGLSAFRLDLGATLLAGATAAVAHIALVWSAGAVPPAGGGARAAEQTLWVAGMVVASGVAFALMAQAVRHAAIRLAVEGTERERLQADLLASVEATQATIGRELHDGVGSHLTGLSFFARGLVKRLERGEAVEVAEMTDAAEMVDDGVRQVRRLARGLTPSEMEPGELASALADLAAAATKATGVRVTSRADDDLPALGAEVEAHLYRIAQEAVTNALRHAQPTHVEISLESDSRGVVLTVEDDGRGIADGGGPGIGLRTMGHRATLAGGALDVEARDGGGTVVRVVLASRPVGG